MAQHAWTLAQGLSKPDNEANASTFSPEPAPTKPLSTLLPGELLVRYVALSVRNRDSIIAYKRVK
ncbi:MAG: hypothetical protein VX694_10845, partial [Planctomycetota bacterium]|nr:hypothetical protein [Planctomycetota bacterium]